MSRRKLARLLLFLLQPEPFLEVAPMSATHSKAAAMIAWTAGPAASISPRNLFSRLLEAGIAANSLIRIQEFFKGAYVRRAKPPATGDGPGESPQEPAHDTLWDDPALWMLMMH